MTYRAGIIGAGGIAGMGILGMHDEEAIGREKFRASHAGGYEAADRIDLVAVADVDAEKVERFGDAWELPESGLYTDHREMLEAEDLDAVSVATPSFLHHEHAIDAARIGDPDAIWCEKPIASSVTDANEMVEVCEEAGAELLINHSFRFTDKLRRLQELVVEEGILGEVHAVTSQFRRELLRNSTHLIDTLVYLLDARARTVSGFINGENDAVDALEGEPVDDSGGGGMVVMDDGTFTTIDCTVAREVSSMLFNFVGTEGKLYLNNDDGEWRYWSLEDGEHVERDLPGIEGAWSWEEDYRNAFPNAARHVVDLLEGDAENHSPGEVATRSLEIIVAFYVSHYTGSQVSIPLDRPLRDVTITSW
ncbi:MAG: Gfo/Idh/MocA family protein [Halobacteriales archaeon]